MIILRNKTRCTSCPIGMTYDTAQKCKCIQTLNIKTDLGCFSSSVSPNPTSSLFYNKLLYVNQIIYLANSSL